MNKTMKKMLCAVVMLLTLCTTLAWAEEAVQGILDKILVVYNMNQKTKDNTTYYPLHVYAGIDSLAYEEVGFEMRAESTDLKAEQSKSTKVVYKSMNVTNQKGEVTKYAASDLGGAYMFGHEMLFTAGKWYNKDTTVYVTPYAIRKDGTKLVGKELTLSDAIIKQVNPASALFKEVDVEVEEPEETPDVEIGNLIASGTTAVTPSEDGKVSGDGILIDATDASAEVPAGVSLEEGATELTLSIAALDESASNVETGETEELAAFDVNIKGVSEENNVPILVTVDGMATNGLNNGNIKLYHVEKDGTKEMTRVDSVAELNAHNQFAYDATEGTLTMSLASFSEVSVVSDTENKWKGTIATAFGGGEGTEESPYIIANADQLAYLGEVISNENKTYGSAYYKLNADINFEGSVFYPIGYHKKAVAEDGTTLLKNTAGEEYYIYGGSFSGTFDGNGHTISNIYQNTWSMDGNYDKGYWDEAMGLFGYVNGGTVKNLTMKNFQSDGEFTPTGCVAAYARAATFENIALVDCNPRVYNTGNGGIVGIGGLTDDKEDAKLTFKNITIDNTNKISALWGSWDVACGGLVGMFRGAGKVDMINCHVAAQIDVFNDVCGNYQYYWYRYAGMLVGTNKNMTTDANGYTVPETSKFYAEDCTVHFGEWNNYYYCELVANSLASYTHDHQFSRLTEVDSVDVANMTVTVNGETTAIPTSGRCNYVVVNGTPATENATCYHFVDGAVHEHKDAGTEVVNGETVLKENNQHIYLPFNQLFTGYGWGVKHIPIYNDGKTYFEGVTILDRVVADSVVKFVGKGVETVTTGESLTIGDLFSEIPNLDSKVAIKSDNVQVSVSPVVDNDGDSTNDSTASAIYTPNTTDWTQGSLTFDGLGKATISITDYYFCLTTTIEITVAEAEVVAKDTFEVKFPNTEKYMYRVGNQNPVALGSLFATKAGVTVDGTKVDVKVESMLSDINSEYDASISEKKADWASRTITFNETGVVKVTIQEEGNLPKELLLEVVDAMNATSAMSATANNVVLLNDISGGFTISNDYTVFGNGFTITCAGTGSYSKASITTGYITMTGGNLADARVICDIYPSSALFTYEMTDKDASGRVLYCNSAIAINGDSKISNCYIYGARNNIYIGGGNVVIEDTVTECGSLSNIHINTTDTYTITLDDLTTIQYLTTSKYDTSKNILGFGVLVGTNTSESNPTIRLTGNLKQYNWTNAKDADSVSNTYAKSAIAGALKVGQYVHTFSATKTVNMGIAYLNSQTAKIIDERIDATSLPYQLGEVVISGYKGQVYSILNTSGITEAWDLEADGVLSYKVEKNIPYEPQLKVNKETLGKEYIERIEGENEYCYVEGRKIKIMFPNNIAEGKKTFDLLDAVEIQKYEGQNLQVTVSCKDKDGNSIAINDGKVDFTETNNYIATYSVTDSVFTDIDGKLIQNTINYTWDIPIDVFVKIATIPNAKFKYISEKQVMGYSGYTKNYKQYIPFLAGLQIYDYNGQKEYLRFNGDSDFNKIASVTIKGYDSSNCVTIETTLVDGGIITTYMGARADSGGSTYTGKIKTANNQVYYVNDGTTGTTTTKWTIKKYTFTGNNGEEITGSTVFGNCQSGTTPSGSFGTTLKYTVSYDANGGSCGQSVGYATSVSPAVILPCPIPPSDWIFVGWYTAPSGGEKVGVPGDSGDSYTPTANITLYAQWGAPCTVTYDANGGECSPESEAYSGEALTLPTPTRDGYWFIGWYDSSEGGNKIGDAGTTYNPTRKITLYAHWQEAIEYTITYNTNGGNEIQEATYQGTALVLPTPNKKGNKFLGWYTAASGGTKIGDAGASYIPSANITLYAQWKKISYNITYSNSNTSSVNGPETATYGETVTVTVVYSEGQDKAPTVKGKESSVTVTSSGSGKNYSYSFIMPAEDVTMTITGSSCVAAGTLITLADGTQKKVEDLTGEELLLVWNLETGSYDAAPITFVDSDAEAEYEIIHLYFADGSDVEVIYEHGFFDTELGKYVYLDRNNAKDYIGHQFVKQADIENNTWDTVELVDVVIENQVTKAYSPVTFEHLCYYTNGILSMPGGIEGLFNIFEVDTEIMAYDSAKMAEDIATYGLFTYADFEGVVSELAYEAFNGDILKVAIGKGLLTWEDIERLAERYMPLISEKQ